MGPFSPGAVATSRVTVGVASANIACVAGRQVILTAPATNADVVYVEFGPTSAVLAVVPVAGAAKGGTPLLPGAMIELSIPAGANSAVTPLIGNFLAYISLTAGQSLWITEGADV